MLVLIWTQWLNHAITKEGRRSPPQYNVTSGVSYPILYRLPERERVSAV